MKIKTQWCFHCDKDTTICPIGGCNSCAGGCGHHDESEISLKCLKFGFWTKEASVPRRKKPTKRQVKEALVSEILFNQFDSKIKIKLQNIFGPKQKEEDSLEKWRKYYNL